MSRCIILYEFSYYRIAKDTSDSHLLCTSNNIKREKRPQSPEDDDVIILSDNDSPSPPMNGLSHIKELDTDLLMVRHTYTKLKVTHFHAVILLTR